MKDGRSTFVLKCNVSIGLKVAFMIVISDTNLAGLSVSGCVVKPLTLGAVEHMGHMELLPHVISGIGYFLTLILLNHIL
jgi:hypothetical protein